MNFHKGHPIRWDNEAECWRYEDGTPINDEKRHCVRCGNMPTQEGHDSCIANLPGVQFACCGHGAERGYIKFENGVIIRGIFEVETSWIN